MKQYIDKDELINAFKKAIKEQYAEREYVGLPAHEEYIIKRY